MNIQELSDMEILQMQWSILEEVKQERAKMRGSQPVKVDIVPKNIPVPKGGFLSKLQNAFKPQETPSRKRSRVLRPPTILPNGIELATSHCKIYTEVVYAGDGIIKLGNRKRFPLSVPQMLDLMKNFDNIPAKRVNARIKWGEEKYGVKMCSFDRIIYNLYKGTFTEIFEEYYNKNYRINFDENGDLQIGE